MGKLMNGVVLTGLLFLTACSEDVTQEPKEEPKEEVIKETPAEPVEAETIEAEPELDAQGINEYATVMSTHLGTFSNIMYDFSDLNLQAGNDPSVMNTDDWITNVAMNLLLMEEVIGDIRSVTAPEELTDVHNVTLKAMDEYQYVVDNYPNAVDNMDVDLMYSCVDAMTRGSEYLNEANQLVTDLVEEQY